MKTHDSNIILKNLKPPHPSSLEKKANTEFILLLVFLFLYFYLISKSNSTEGCHVKFSMSCVIQYKVMPSAIYNIKSFFFWNIFTYDKINIFSTFHSYVCKYADLLTYLWLVFFVFWKREGILYINFKIIYRQNVSNNICFQHKSIKKAWHKNFQKLFE